MTDAGPAIDIRPVTDFSSLAALWRDLEERADGSFFQSWAWTGCLAEERFADPWLLSASRGDRVVALALFNRAPCPRFRATASLLLGENGKAAQDTIFIEHNGLLIDRSESSQLAQICYAALAASKVGALRWVLSGVPESIQAMLPAERKVRVLARRPAPYVDFAQIGGENLLEALSPNARQQLRRSLRAWEKIGPLSLDVAGTPEEADLFLVELKKLHQSYWTSRGRPGAFAQPFFERFHHALIRRPSAGQSVDLLRVRAGDRVLGYLYNLVHHGWVAAYQSGFDFGPDAEQLRPGLICHLQAIEYYRHGGQRYYDFLGGEARYKRSFANADRALLWLDVRRRLFPAFLKGSQHGA